MARRKRSEGPKSPLEWGERVKIRTAAGLQTEGKVSFIGWMPFPGVWSFEVTTDDGQVYKTHGSELAAARIARIEGLEEIPRTEQTEAGAQYVAPGTPARQVPQTGLRPKAKQNTDPMPLELARGKANQQKLFEED